MWRNYSDDKKAVSLYLVVTPDFIFFFGGKMKSWSSFIGTLLFGFSLLSIFLLSAQRTNTFSSFFVVNFHHFSPTTPSTRRPRPLTPRRRLPMTPRRPTARMMMMMRMRMSPTKPERGCFSDLLFFIPVQSRGCYSG